MHLKKMFKIEREREEGRREQKTNMRAKMNSQLISAKDCRYWGGIGGKHLELGRDQFIQGRGISDDFHGKAFMSQQESLLKTACCCLSIKRS